TASKLAADYKSLQDDLPRLKQTVADLDALKGRVSTVESQVARVVPSPELKGSMGRDLIETLTRYSRYLAGFGLQATRVPSVAVVAKMPDGCYHGCFYDNQIFILKGSPAPALAVHEYSHNVLMPQDPADPDRQWQYSALEGGVANYLTADFLNSPV